MIDRVQRSSVLEADERRLVAAGWLFAVGTAVHTFDHLRRGQSSVTEQLYWVGNVSLVLQVVVITLVVTRHRLAPAAATAVGFPLAIGFAAAHWLPHWSSLSDSFVDQHVSVFSWFASGLEIVGAAAIGIAGLRALLQRR
jgi:hypothetical protein